MTFPPADVLAAEMHFYQMTALAAQLQESVADLGLSASVEMLPSAAPVVTVPMPNGGKVLVALHSHGAWVIARPRSGFEVDLTGWSLETEAAALVAIASETVRALLEGRSVRSPWCWGRTSPSKITELADHLVDLGVPEEALEVPRPVNVNEDGKPVTTYGPLGWLRVGQADGSWRLEVRFHEGFGWSVDLVDDEPGLSGRMDLRMAALGLEDGPPEVPEDSVHIRELAELLAIEMDWLLPAEGVRPVRRYAPTPRACDGSDPGEAAAAIGAWLRWCGFTDAAAGREGKRHVVKASHLTIHQHGAKAPAGLGVVQRVRGLASVAGTRAVVVSASGFTRDAVRWSDQSGVALFEWSWEGRLHPRGRIATALMPVLGKPLPARCEDPTCMAIGCVLDSEYCPNDVGAPWANPNSWIFRR